MRLHPTIRVHTVSNDAQSEATTRLLIQAGVEFDTVPAAVLIVVFIDHTGELNFWTGYRPDRLNEAIVELKSV